MKNACLVYVLLLISFSSGKSFCQSTDSVRLKIKINDGEFWWVGIINHGSVMPIEEGYNADLYANLYGNQAQPLLLSSKGQVIWSEEPFKITCDKNGITLSKEPGKEFIMVKPGNNLREAYLYSSKNFFHPSGEHPDRSLFINPQYNTWIELLYDQNQNDILRYARSIVDNGFPPGVIMIDDNWQEDYGTWRFHPGRFPDPGVMVDTLHRLGFKVMVWVCPFVSPDSEVFRKLQAKGALLNDKEGYPKIVKWWNGASAVLDFTDPNAVNWYKAELNALMKTTGIDGFKFDAGDPEYYIDTYGDRKISPNEHAELFARIGLEYPLNEYRATWKMGGQALAQRLRDKGHSWSDLQLLVPNILLQGIMGYPYTCPDMIGGGEMGSFINLKNIDQDLVVRSAQCHALMPMMQFSVAPWRILDKEHLSAIKKSIELRSKYVALIESLTRQAALTGEPMVRMMEYNFPHQGFAEIDDQFMLGESILVAPVLTPGNDRKVVLPKGKWRDGISGKVIHGPRTLEIHAAIDELAYYIKE